MDKYKFIFSSTSSITGCARMPETALEAGAPNVFQEAEYQFNRR